MRFTHCGRMISHVIWLGVNASESAASHCVAGTDRTAPRTISETLAITGRAKPTTAFNQSGNGIVVAPNRIWKGIKNIAKNRSTSHGAFRKNWVSAQAGARIKGRLLSCTKPKPIPDIVPRAMAASEIKRLKAKPLRSSGAHLRSTANAVKGALTADSAAATPLKSVIAATITSPDRTRAEGEQPS